MRITSQQHPKDAADLPVDVEAAVPKRKVDKLTKVHEMQLLLGIHNIDDSQLTPITVI